MSVAEMVSSRPILTAKRLAKIKERLWEARLNLKVIQNSGDPAFYGEALVEYARILGELEGYVRGKDRYFND